MPKRPSLRNLRSLNREKRNKQEQNPVNLKDEDISSGEEDENQPELEEEEEFEEETAEDKRRRLSQKFLDDFKRIEDEDRDDNDSDEDQYVSERLKIERLKSKGKYFRSFANSLSSLNTNELTQQHYYGHKGSLTCLALSQDEQKVVTGSKDNSIIVWDIDSGSKTTLKPRWNSKDASEPSHKGEILAVAISSDQRLVVCGGRDRIIRVFDQRMENSEVKKFDGHRDIVTGLAFQHGTYNLISASHDRCLKYWDLNQMTYVETLFGHQDYVSSVDCWHKLKPLSCSSDRTVRSWKVEQSTHLVFRGHKGPIDTGKILTDDTFLTGSQDGKISYWKDSKKNAVSSRLAAHGFENTNPRWITSLSTIKSSDSFASGSYDGFIKLWTLNNEQITHQVDIPVNGFINDLAYTNKMIIAACGREHKLGRWWNLKNAKDRLTIIRFNGDLEESMNNSNSNFDEESESEDSEDTADNNSTD